mmetsp:Transcript_17863/g.47622  ORF Transcript_17863/g.47622 Transcript_17863/m.47622 type:complete len:329 (-) Transcript_17863:241-1227(-)
MECAGLSAQGGITYRHRVLTAGNAHLWTSSRLCSTWSGSSSTQLNWSSCGRSHLNRAGCRPFWESALRLKSSEVDFNPSSARRQHCKLLRKLQGCMARVGHLNTDVATACKQNGGLSHIEGASQFSCRAPRRRSSSSGGVGAGGGSGSAPWPLDATGADLSLLAALPGSSSHSSPRSSDCASEEQPPSLAATDQWEEGEELEREEEDWIEPAGVATWPWAMLNDIRPAEAPLRHEASRMIFWAALSVGACIMLTLLSKFVIALDIGLVKCSPEYIDGTKSPKGSEDIIRIDALLRVVILACISFFAGMGLSAMQPAVYSIDWVLLLGM